MSAFTSQRSLVRSALASILAGVALMIATVTTVLGAGPVHTQDVLHWDDEIALECDGFLVMGTSQDLYRNILTWYDGAGDVELQRRRVHFDFTLVNLDSGATAEFVGHMVIVQDANAGTTTIRGASRQLWAGGRLVAAVAGMTTFSADEERNVGHSSLGEFDEAVCDALG